MAPRAIPRPINAGPGSSGSYNSIYRGLVVSNSDPLQMNRLQAQVPAVGGLVSGWAMPCTEFDCKTTPPIGTHVWIMFEGGDPAYPVWVGCFPG